MHIANALLYRGSEGGTLGAGDLRSLIENAWVGAGADKVTGNVANNDIDGNAGNDTLDGGAGDDTIQGGADNDSITGGAVDNDKLYGEAGNDTIDAGHGNDSVYGGGNADRLLGSDGADSIEGGGGNDSLDGGLQNDTLRGGAGADTIIGGGTDNDLIFGDEDQDSIDAGAGDDTIDGGQGNDTVLGGAGSDKILGGDIDLDILSGQAGNDTIDGGNGDDQIDGGEDNDSLLGGGGADYIHGGAGTGNDTLDGGTGADTLAGGLGNDTYLWRGNAVILENASEGVDTVQLYTGAIESTFASNFTENFEVMVATGVVVWGNDYVDGSGNSNVMTSGAGNDWFYGKGGKDTLIGNAGNDRLDGGAGADSMEGGADNDTYVWDDAGDTINDSSGNDTIEINTTSSFNLDTANITGTIENVGLGEAAGAVNLTGDENANGLSGNSFANTLRGLDGADTINGNGGADLIYGGELASGVDVGDSVNGGGGDDTLFGARGNDTLWAGDGNDSVFGGDDNDSIDGNLGNDRVYGEAGNDTLIGGANDDDWLEGGAGNDSADGGSGNDSLWGGGGNDTLIGGFGNDRLGVLDGRSTATAGSGSDVLQVNWETINYGVFTEGWTGSFAAGYGGLIREYYNSSNRVDFTGVERFQITTGSGADDVTTGDGIDTISSGGGNDIIRSGLGADVINGGNDLDILVGDKSAATAGFDINLNSASSSYVVGGVTGSITNVEALGINGGAAFITGSGADNIITTGEWLHENVQTNGGADRVQFRGGRDYADLGAGSDTLVINWSTITYDATTRGWDEVGTLATGYTGYINDYYNSSNRIDFTGVENFWLITGSAADFLRSGDGDDTLSGGGGNDTLMSAKGVDVIQGGLGDSDRWDGDKSFATASQEIDVNLTKATQSTYLTNGRVSGIEVITLATGAGADDIVTLGSFLNDVITTNGGADTVKIAGGRDSVSMGGQGAGTVDTLTIDWSGINYDEVSYDVLSGQGITGSLATGYSGYIRNYYNDQNRVDFSGVENFNISTGSANDWLRTGDGDDTLKGGDGNDVLLSAQGVDDIYGGLGDQDRWDADKSFAGNSQAISVDLTQAGTQSTYLATGHVEGIEVLTLATGGGADNITTLSSFLSDVITTNGGADTVKIAGGRDTVSMGGQGAGASDSLVIDWSYVGEGMFYENWASDATGYSGLIRDYYNTAQRVDFSGVERFDIRTGSGQDHLRTGVGADAVDLGGADDTIRGGSGADTLNGGAGNDVWVGDQSAATAGMVINLAAACTWALATGTGSVTGFESLGRGDEFFNSGSGGDNLTTLGLTLNDFINTNAGADRVLIGGGRDVVNMGADADTLVISWASIGYGVFIEGWDETNAATTGYSGLYRDYYNTANRVDFTGVNRFEITTGSGDDGIRTGDSDDIVSTGDGNDQIDTAKGVDQVNGGLGDNDRWIADKSFTATAITVDLTKALQSSYLTAGTLRGIEALTLTTGGGDDVITTLGTLSRTDVVNTGGGADTVTIANGRDTVNLGANAKGTFDTLVIDWSAFGEGMTSYDWVSGADGYAGNIRDYYNTANRVDFTGVDRFDARMGTGDDYMRTGDGSDYVNGGAGNDWLVTGRGVDSIEGGLGNDRWEADKSYVTEDIVLNIQKAAPQVYLTTGYIRAIEMLSLTTGGGNDDITTGTGFFADTLSTRGGNDNVTVAGGRDVVDLGAAGAGGDRLIVDWQTSGEGYTLYDLVLGATGYGGNVRDYYNTAQRVDFVGVERFQFKLGGGGDNITTGDGIDTLSGGGGNDYLAGAGDNDKLFGGDGSDTLVGGDGADVVNSGFGADNLSGGAGGDIFSFGGLSDSSATDGVDLITDLDDLTDRIDLKKIDANTTASGDQKFVKVAAFDGNAGQLVVSAYDSVADRTYIYGDVDGDGLADFTLALVGDHDAFNRFVL